MTDNTTEFRRNLSGLINAHSLENGSNTPDFFLADFLTDCLQAYDKTVIARDDWFGDSKSPGAASRSTSPSETTVENVAVDEPTVTLRDIAHPPEYANISRRMVNDFMAQIRAAEDRLKGFSEWIDPAHFCVKPDVVRDAIVHYSHTGDILQTTWQAMRSYLEYLEQLETIIRTRKSFFG